MKRQAVDPRVRFKHLLSEVPWAPCDKCSWLWPEHMLRDHSGIRICPNHRSYTETTKEKTVRIERAAARLARGKDRIPRWPTPPEFREVAAPYEMSPNPVSIRPGVGANVVFTGRNLTDADPIAFVGHGATPNIVVDLAVAGVVDPDTRKNTLTIAIRATAAPYGKFDLNYDGNVFPQSVEVHS